MKKSRFLFISLLIIALLCISAFAAEKVVYVDGTALSAGNGSTPESALKTFAEGVKIECYLADRISTLKYLDRAEAITVSAQ